MPFGALIGVVELVDVVPNHPSQCAVSGQSHWVLAKLIALQRSIEYRGRQGLFEAAEHFARDRAMRWPTEVRGKESVDPPPAQIDRLPSSRSWRSDR